MRTTLMIDDDLLRTLKEKAAKEGRTLQAVANELLRQALRRPKAQYKLKLTGWTAQPLAGIDVADRDKLFDVMNGLDR